MTILLCTNTKLPHGVDAVACLHFGGVKEYPLPYQWFYDHIYRIGFSTREAAEAWAVTEGLILQNLIKG